MRAPIKAQGPLSEEGFTLLEVIIALTIMVIAFASILSVQSSSINASARAHQMTIVAMLAKNEMVDTEYAIRGKTFDEMKEEDGEQFKEPYQDYRWTRTVKEIEFPNLNFSAEGGEGESTAGQNTASGQAAQGSSTMDTMTSLITQFLSQATRQVTVTIHWKKMGKDQSFSLTTYWVDLNHEFQVSQ